jgi:hypothetical protein
MGQASRGRTTIAASARRQSCTTTSTTRKGSMAITRTASERTLVMIRWICCTSARTRERMVPVGWAWKKPADW